MPGTILLIALTKGDTTVEVTVGKTALSINGKVAGYMDTNPVLRSGRVFLPARYAAEAFGHAIRWDQAAQKIYIGSEGSSTGLSLKSSLPETSPSKNDKISSTRTENKNSKTTIVVSEEKAAVYKYAGGVMVGVEGKHWFLSLSGGKPAQLTITDPDTGEQRRKVRSALAGKFISTFGEVGRMGCVTTQAQICTGI